MPRAAVPFSIRRGDDVFGEQGFTSTTETVHGVLHLEGDRLHLQWRRYRETERFGREIRTDQEVEPVREATVPLGALAGASVRRPWWGLGRVARLVLTATDLRAFEQVAGAEGLQLTHPAQLVVRLRREDVAAARELAAELDLALADRALQAAAAPDPTRAIPGGSRGAE